MSATPPRYQIQGREVTLPCHVGHASSVAASFLVDAGVARGMLPSDELDVVELLPGRALFSLAGVDYRENDLGQYHEISLAFFVRERRAPRGLPMLGPAIALLRSQLPTCIVHLPVSESFSCEAGCRIWGFPKTVDDVRVEFAAGRVDCRWVKDGRSVLRFSAPASGSRSLPEQSMQTYSVLEGALHSTRFVSRSEGVGFSRSGVQLELGDHPVADELRALGLPRKPLFCVSMERMQARFEAPEKL